MAFLAFGVLGCNNVSFRVLSVLRVTAVFYKQGLRFYRSILQVVYIPCPFPVPLVIILALSFQGWIRSAFLILMPVLFAALFLTFTRGPDSGNGGDANSWRHFPQETQNNFDDPVHSKFLVIAGLAYKSVIPSRVIMHGTEKLRIEALELSEEIRKYPLTGIGYGKETFAKYYPAASVKHAHNIFLNTAVETGVIGLLIFAAILAVIIRRFIREIRDETTLQQRLLISGIFTSFIGFLSLNLFDYMYHGWPGQMVWMLIGIGYAIINKNHKKGRNILQSG